MFTFATAAGAMKDLNPVTALVGGKMVIAFNLFHKIHRLWCWKQSVDSIRENSQNTTQYLSGAFCNFVTKGTPLESPLKTAAMVALIGSLLFKTIQRYNEFCAAYKDWLKAIKCQHLIRAEFDTHPELHKLSPMRLVRAFDRGVETSLRIKSYSVAMRVRLIAHYTLNFLAAAFKLSSSLMEINDALSLKGLEKAHATNSVFMNMQKTLDEMSAHKESVVESLEKNSHVIDRYLNTLNLTYKTKDIIKAVEKVGDASKEGSNNMKEATKVVSGIAGRAWEFLKGAAWTSTISSTVEATHITEKNIIYKDLSENLPYFTPEIKKFPQSVDELVVSSAAAAPGA